MNQAVASLTTQCASLWEKFSASEEIKRVAIWDFEDPIRLNWYNTIERRGVRLSTLPPELQVACLKLFIPLFAEDGLKKFKLMLQHNTLSAYYFCFYGKPDEHLPWGFSMEGPNLSLNYTLKGALISFSPMMFGANPSKIIMKDGKPHDIMMHEEGIATDLVSMFNWFKTRKIKQGSVAPSELLYSLKEKLDYTPRGLPLTQFTEENQKYFIKMLLSVYIEFRLSPVLVEIFYSRFKGAISDLKFSWIGSTEQDSKHYYSIATPTFIIEFLNKEPNKNNIVTVFREKGCDFGENFI